MCLFLGGALHLPFQSWEGALTLPSAAIGMHVYTHVMIVTRMYNVVHTYMHDACMCKHPLQPALLVLQHTVQRGSTNSSATTAQMIAKVW